ncbi:MAG: hypothetical protein II093_04780, partial [Selenomonas sp.]|nr:hypothetical protein [Selenomonas sp.]
MYTPEYGVDTGSARHPSPSSTRTRTSRPTCSCGNDSRYPGKPDIVLPKYRTMIFVHGCFWHRHPECRYATTPSTNRDFWQKKFDQNVARDWEVQEQLKADGWHVIVVWECEISRKADREERLQRLERQIRE